MFIFEDFVLRITELWVAVGVGRTVVSDPGFVTVELLFPFVEKFGAAFTKLGSL
jgi:hypothetical protein